MATVNRLGLLGGMAQAVMGGYVSFLLGRLPEHLV
jgi:hypothetical protein